MSKAQELYDQYVDAMSYGKWLCVEDVEEFAEAAAGELLGLQLRLERAEAERDAALRRIEELTAQS